MQAEIRAIDPEMMPMVEQWREYKTTVALFEPEFVVKFLEWLLLEVHGAQLGEERMEYSRFRVATCITETSVNQSQNSMICPDSFMPGL